MRSALDYLIPVIGVLPLLFVGCGPAPEVTAAQLITALATKIPIAASTSESSDESSSSEASALPSQISCNNDIYELSGGTVTNKPVQISGNSATVLLTVDVSANGPGLSVTSSGGASSTSTSNVHCSFYANYGYDPAISSLKGAGTILTCDHFDCIIQGSKVSCEKLQAALAATVCY